MISAKTELRVAGAVPAAGFGWWLGVLLSVAVLRLRRRLNAT